MLFRSDLDGCGFATDVERYAMTQYAYNLIFKTLKWLNVPVASVFIAQAAIIFVAKTSIACAAAGLNRSERS